jgi:hypothetical protein
LHCPVLPAGAPAGAWAQTVAASINKPIPNTVFVPVTVAFMATPLCDV